MEAAIEFLRSNYVYTQIFSSIGKNFADIESLDFCLLARERSVCWQERDLSGGRRRERERERQREREREEERAIYIYIYTYIYIERERDTCNIYVCMHVYINIHI